MAGVKGRADTDVKKERAIDRVIVAWKAVPNLRLGQLIDVAVFSARKLEGCGGLFTIEDEHFVEAIERQASALQKEKP
jgi:hypothetical protein